VVKGVFLDDTEVFLKVDDTAVALSSIVKVENTAEQE
jgi:hypothetical protein